MISQDKRVPLANARFWVRDSRIVPALLTTLCLAGCATKMSHGGEGSPDGATDYPAGGGSTLDGGAGDGGPGLAGDVASTGSAGSDGSIVDRPPEVLATDPEGVWRTTVTANDQTWWEFTITNKAVKHVSYNLIALTASSGAACKESDIGAYSDNVTVAADGTFATDSGHFASGFFFTFAGRFVSATLVEGKYSVSFPACGELTDRPFQAQRLLGDGGD